MNNTPQSELDSHKRETGSKVSQPSCLVDQVRTSGAVRWGIRKRVSYLPKKAKEVKPKTIWRVESESESKVEGGSLKQEMAESTVVEGSLALVKSLSRGKRKREESSGASERRSKKIAGRWSVERCESAKNALLEVVKEMEATWQKPVLRHELRAKARKRIGDTGLLDHLLKHMAGVVFADRKNRLIRRHNSEGAIQYWLEPAELAGIRREAGISDIYWVPPPGWKLGDAISDYICDGHCKEMISQCKEDINLLKSEIAELKKTVIAELMETVKSQQEEICLLKEENEKRRKDPRAVMVNESYETSIASLSGKKLVQDKVKVKPVVAGNEVGTMKKTARTSGFRILQPDGTFLWPDHMASSGLTGFSSHSMPSSTSLPPQLIALPSPTSPLPPPLPAFFCQQQPDNNPRVHSFSQAQSNGVLAYSLAQGIAKSPTARYESLPHASNSYTYATLQSTKETCIYTEDMMNSSGANANNFVEMIESSTLPMAPAMNSEKTTGVMTDLTLSSFNY